MNIRKLYRAASIKAKLVVFGMVISFVTVTGTVLAFVIYDLSSSAISEAKKVEAMTVLLSRNASGALASKDSRSAHEVLSALATEPSFLVAKIVDSDGIELSKYPESGEPFDFSKFQNEKSEIVGRRILSHQSIFHEGNSLGDLYVIATLDRIYNRILRSLLIAVWILVISLTLSFALGLWLQGGITSRIRSIAKATENISQTKDYTLRLHDTSKDEIGVLVQGFNLMLEEVQERDFALTDAQKNLGKKVEDRTKELRSEIIQRKKYEDALLREQRQLRLLIEDAPIGVAMYDMELRNLVHSKRWLSDFEIKEADILDMLFLDLFTDSGSYWSEITTKALAKKTLSSSEDRVRLRSGTEVYVRWEIHPWFTPEGNQGGIVVVMDRIDDLVESREKALETARIQTEFVANVSHELRTPLNGIYGFTEILSETDLNEDQRDHLNIIESSTKLLLNLINDLLEYSRIQSGKFVFEENEVDLRECVPRWIKQFEAVAGKKNVGVGWNIADNVPKLLIADEYRLQQVVFNLMSNSVKFTEYGEILLLIEAEKFPDKDVYKLEWRVLDSGAGIPKEKQDLIFEAFSQADGSTTRRYGGTGLGLAICRHLVAKMNGNVWVESLPNVGSTFVFSTELKLGDGKLSQKLSQEAGHTTLSFANLEGKSILVAEDNKVNQALAKKLLEKLGCNVEVVENGKEAVDRVGERSFDCILLDIQMPIMDGYEAARILQSRFEADEGSRIPIVAFTAHAFLEDRVRCMEAGMRAVIPKPVKREELARILSEVITPL